MAVGFLIIEIESENAIILHFPEMAGMMRYGCVVVVHIFFEIGHVIIAFSDGLAAGKGFL